MALFRPHRLFLFSIIISLFLLMGCNNVDDISDRSSTNLNDTPQPRSQPMSEQTEVKSSEKQGIQGEVVQITGDQMPTIGTTKQRTPPQPVETTVWIFADTIPATSPRIPISQIQSQFQVLQKVKTDNQGRFFVELPPGKYTLFAQYGEDLYLNSFAGDGSYSTVEVMANQTSRVRLVNSETATF